MTYAPLPSPDHAPLRSLGWVTHVGTLKPSDKGRRGESYEGTGLSVSEHPQHWVTIARLGGLPWWRTDLTRHRLLDAHAFVRAHGPGLGEWGQAQGWVEAQRRYAVSWYDDEAGARVTELVATRQEAQSLVEEADPSSKVRCTAVDPCWVATPALDRRMGRQPSNGRVVAAHALEDLATVWAQDHGLDGVWWQDALAPRRLSAPRGVVFAELATALVWQPTSPEPAPPPRRSRP